MSTGKLASVVFYRDMTASICLAVLTYEKRKLEIQGSYGKIEYKPVGSLYALYSRPCQPQVFHLWWP